MIHAVIIDDEPAVAKIIRYFIGSNDLPVTIIGEAYDGESGLRLIRQKNPELIFLDIQMPKMNGFEIMSAAPNYTYIIITAFESFKYAQEALRLGAKDILLKPIEYATLSSSVIRATGWKFTSNSTVNNILEYIQLHYNEKIEVAGLAKMFFTTSSHIARLFKKHTGTTVVSGKIECQAKPDLITTNIVTAVQNCDVIMVVATTDAHSQIAKALAPHLNSSQAVVLCPGHVLGSLEFLNTIKANGCASLPIIGETADLPYACRTEEVGHTFHSGLKTGMAIATVPSKDVTRLLEIIGEAFPMFYACQSILDTSTNNAAVIMHPIPCVMNINRIDTGKSYSYYEEGFSYSICKILEIADKERLAVCHALSLQRDSVLTILNKAYNRAETSLFEFVVNTPAFKGVKSPVSMQHRFVVEDTINGLVPWASLGKLLGVPTPVMSMFIDLIGLIMDRDFWREGRTVEKLGLAGLSAQEIVALCTA